MIVCYRDGVTDQPCPETGRSGVGQSVARVAHNHEVAGSSPAAATMATGAHATAESGQASRFNSGPAVALHTAGSAA